MMMCNLFYLIVNNVTSKWVPEIRKYCPKVPFVLVGMKTDLREDEATLSKMKEKFGRGAFTYEEGVAKAEEIGAMRYMECSSLLGTGLKELFHDPLHSLLYGDGLKYGETPHGRCCLQ